MRSRERGRAVCSPEEKNKVITLTREGLKVVEVRIRVRGGELLY